VDVLAYADGQRDLIGLAEIIGADALDCAAILDRLAAAGLVAEITT
jgi:aminopeptidase-like protein